MFWKALVFITTNHEAPPTKWHHEDQRALQIGQEEEKFKWL